MLVFFNLKPPCEKISYGGGLFFVENLIDYLKSKKISVTFDLENDIDVIFIIDPRKGKFRKYDIEDIFKYKKKNPKSIIIHRINESNIKRKEGGNIEEILLKTMKNADIIIFVSKWLQDYYTSKYNLDKLENKKFLSILNGCNHTIFYPKNKSNNNKLKIVTHHWSNNYFKGFEIYNELDKILQKRNDFEFIFIGNYNPDYKPTNITLYPPCQGKELANILRKCDVYLTATVNEPGGAHYLEGISCGLPILYRTNGGGVHEICKDFGEEFKDIDSLFEKLEVLKSKSYKDDYKYLNSERCNDEYFNLILSSIKKDYIL